MKSPETRRKPVQKRTKIVRDKTAFGKIFKQIRRLKTDAADGGKNPHFFPLFHTDTLAQRRRFRSFPAGQNDIKVLVFAFVFRCRDSETSEQIRRANGFQIPTHRRRFRVNGLHIIPKGGSMIEMPQVDKLVHNDIVQRRRR